MCFHPGRAWLQLSVDFLPGCKDRLGGGKLKWHGALVCPWFIFNNENVTSDGQRLTEEEAWRWTLKVPCPAWRELCGQSGWEAVIISIQTCNERKDLCFKLLSPSNVDVNSLSSCVSVGLSLSPPHISAYVIAMLTPSLFRGERGGGCLWITGMFTSKTKRSSQFLFEPGCRIYFL